MINYEHCKVRGSKWTLSKSFGKRKELGQTIPYI